MRLHARPDELDAVDPVADALLRELHRVRRRRHRAGRRACDRRAEHERPAEEADEVVLLGRKTPRAAQCQVASMWMGRGHVHIPGVGALRYELCCVDELGLLASLDEVLGDGFHRVVVHLQRNQ